MKIKIGLLPLYIKLYDDINSPKADYYKFYDKLISGFESQGIDVIKSDICRTKPEFQDAVKQFENEGANVIVTIHMAYSPSLECIDALVNTKLPIVVMDTTEGLGFSKEYSNSPIMNNHGIHGVMDMCNLLIRKGKKFGITAGHLDNSDVLKQTCDYVKASVAANLLKGSRIGLFGTSFDGMGDFIVTPREVKKRFGIELQSITDKEMQDTYSTITEKEVETERDFYKKNFDGVDLIDKDILDYSIKAGLTVRKIINNKKLDAFSINFLGVKQKNLKSMPFVETCLEMQNGIGYAGEGDALTASFEGVLRRVYKDVSFVEIFCPDWKENRLFISHMGEMNYDVADRKPMLKKSSFAFTNAYDCIKGLSQYKTGKAVFINVFRGEGEKFKLIVSDIEFIDPNTNEFDNSIRGWFKTKKDIPEFLCALSENGAIHHSIVIYDADIMAIKHFGKLLDMEVIEI